ARLAAVLWTYSKLKQIEDVIRVGVRVIVDPACSASELQSARRFLGQALAPLDEERWGRLKKMGLSVPEGKAAGRAKELVRQLSDDEFYKRLEARQELQKIGGAALPELIPL